MIHNLSMLTFHLPPPPRPRVAPHRKLLVWSRRAPKVNRLLRTLKLNWLFSNPKNPPRTLPVHDVIHTSWSHFLSGIFILTSLNDTSSPRAREHLRSCLHLTNPCAKRKVLSLTKPKGKIYKTKSLGHYITDIYKRNENFSNSYQPTLLSI